MVVFVQILNTVYTVEENEWQMPRGKAGFACPLCHVCEMFICLEFFECHKIRSVHAPPGGGGTAVYGQYGYVPL